jgi:C4-dicarboxylate-specific signal transduction histidine kinase
VLDSDGRIIAAHSGWAGFAPSASGMGSSYLEIWSDSARKGDATAASVLKGVSRVLDGTDTDFAVEYPAYGPNADSWWLMRAVPLKRPAGGAVVTHTDRTDAHKAELEARQSRDELAHLSRVVVVGELTTSLSHQLSQPLTGIVGNAQAGRRFLDVKRPDLGELRQIFTDILADAARATDQVRGLRDLLRKGSTDHEVVAINAIVEETSRIVRSDAMIRGVSLHIDMSPSGPSVRGNRVQLQQVVLNLVLNALEAVALRSGGPRRVELATESRGQDGVVVSVSDTGPGLPASAETVFEAFYTTKPSGIGLGLSIARSIVGAHGGSIYARDRPDGGAVFYLTLPSAAE